MLKDNLNIKIYAFMFLLYHTTLASFLGLYSAATPPYIQLMISMAICFSIFIIYEPNNINKFLFASFIISSFSLIIGIFNKWYLFDVVGDSVRFVAPFFAYAVGLKLLSKLNFDQLEYIVKLSILIFSISALFSALKVFNILINSELLFNYTERVYLNVPILLFLYVYLFFTLKPLTKIHLFAIFLVAPLFFIGLLSNLSKINFILMIIFLILPMFIFKKHILNIFITAILCCILYFSYSLVSDRFVIMYKTISESINEKKTSRTDLSTSARLFESTSAINELNKSPFSYLTGNGSGALLFNIPTERTGISKSNFRENGGLHHIHVEYVLILYRHGIIGLSFYLFWTIYIVKHSLNPVLKYNHKMVKLSIFSLAIGIYFLSQIFVASTNASLYGKVGNGLIGSLGIALSNLINKYEK